MTLSIAVKAHYNSAGSYVSRDIRKLPVISTTEEGEDVETRGRERSVNSESQGYSFEGMSGANTQGDISAVEAAERAAVGRREKRSGKRRYVFILICLKLNFLEY